jgi:fructose-bisphosphate aldolase class II
MTAGVREVFVKDPSVFDPRGYLKAGRKNVQDIVAHKIKDVLGSNGAASTLTKR